ncbi:MAG: NADH-quinone oxidoreductase subunit L [Rhodanobacteraceae bacterium]
MPAALATLALVAPAALVAITLLALRHPGLRPRRVLLASRLASVLALLLAIAAAILVARFGAVTSPLLGWYGLGLSVRLDALTCCMFLLIAFVGLIVLQYSRNYLDGDPRQGEFLGGLCLTLAAVTALVLAGNLLQLVGAWIATSLSLHRLLVFYRDRRAAVMAARKKFIVARLSDICLIGAALALASAFGSADLATILDRARQLTDTPAPVSAAAVLLAIAALLKSAQFPTHGWLPEVMETPTPVSALLHAGIINAGGFLVIRFADVMVLFGPALHLLAIIGGFTALFGAVVMLTQPSIKGSLAWSTVGQMGFMLLECGLAAFPIALVHLVAHSLYKAHAFLASGSVVEIARTRWQPDLKHAPGVATILGNLTLALGIYAVASWLFGFLGNESAAMLSLGAILVMSLSLLLAQASQGRGHAAVLARTAMLAMGATVMYFVLQGSAAWLLASTLPPPTVPDAAGLLIMLLAVASFGMVTVLQILAPKWLASDRWCAMRIHLANGLYANSLFNRLIGALRTPNTPAR